MKQSKITQEEFAAINNKFTEDRLALMNGVKTSEYAVESSRFHNFNAAALMATPWLRNKTGNDSIEMTPLDMAYLFSLKHQVSIVDIVAGKQVSKEQLQEKFGDNANYNDIQHTLAVEDANERHQQDAGPSTTARIVTILPQAEVRSHPHRRNLQSIEPLYREVTKAASIFDNDTLTEMSERIKAIAVALKDRILDYNVVVNSGGGSSYEERQIAARYSMWNNRIIGVPKGCVGSRGNVDIELRDETIDEMAERAVAEIVDTIWWNLKYDKDLVLYFYISAIEHYPKTGLCRIVFRYGYTG